VIILLLGLIRKLDGNSLKETSAVIQETRKDEKKKEKTALKRALCNKAQLLCKPVVLPHVQLVVLGQALLELLSSKVRS